MDEGSRRLYRFFAAHFLATFHRQNPRRFNLEVIQLHNHGLFIDGRELIMENVSVGGVRKWNSLRCVY